MYQHDNGHVALRIVTALVEELHKRDPDLGLALQSSLNSAEKAARDEGFADASEAARIVRNVTS